MSDTYTVTRSISIDQPPETVYAKVADFGQWEDWSPWNGIDPDMATTTTGTAGEVGQKFTWSGNRKVGEGSMLVTAANGTDRVDVDLEFLRPYKSQSQVTWTVAPSGAGSEVTWAMTGKNTFMTKVMALFGKSMDKMVGPDFEKGLSKLKTAIEA